MFAFVADIKNFKGLNLTQNIDFYNFVNKISVSSRYKYLPQVSGATNTFEYLLTFLLRGKNRKIQKVFKFCNYFRRLRIL